ncbi:hypothetical protein JW868_03380 [Candidatus Woesearchaeota archaeon]|nr:hypothetical protein [Candidatus Woesearchaeota archaeon]
MKVCPNCNKEFKEHEIFCSSCGKKLEKKQGDDVSANQRGWWTAQRIIGVTIVFIPLVVLLVLLIVGSISIVPIVVIAGSILCLLTGTGFLAKK